MKANVLYRIKLKELEVSTLKQLPCYDVDDSEEIHQEKHDQLIEVMNLLDELEQTIKEDQSTDFKEKARIRLIDDVRKHRLGISFTLLELDGDRQELANRFLRLNLDLADSFSEILYGYVLVTDLALGLERWIDEKFIETFLQMDDEFIVLLYDIFELYEESQGTLKSRLEIPELIGIISMYEKQINDWVHYLLEVGSMVDEGKIKTKRISYDFSEWQGFLDSLVDDYGLLDNYIW